MASQLRARSKTDFAPGKREFLACYCAGCLRLQAITAEYITNAQDMSTLSLQRSSLAIATGRARLIY